MAPRSEFLSLDNSGLIEFKPRTGTWASYDAWSQPRLSEYGEQSSSCSMDDSSSCSSSSSSKRRTRRVVRFARSNETHEYLHKSEYTADEKDACFFKRSDYQAMRAHNAETIDKLNHQLPLNELEESHIGLEGRTPIENVHIHHMMRSAILAVLDEQDDQYRFDGCLHDELLALRYQSYTYEARDRARCLGCQQSLEVL